MSPEKFIGDNVVAPLLLLFVVIVTAKACNTVYHHKLHTTAAAEIFVSQSGHTAKRLRSEPAHTDFDPQQNSHTPFYGFPTSGNPCNYMNYHLYLGVPQLLLCVCTAYIHLCMCFVI